MRDLVRVFLLTHARARSARRPAVASGSVSADAARTRSPRITAGSKRRRSRRIGALSHPVAILGPGVSLADFKGFPDSAAPRVDRCCRVGRAMDTVTMTDRHLRTVIADHSPDFIRTVSDRILSEPRLVVVATAESGFAALHCVGRSPSGPRADGRRDARNGRPRDDAKDQGPSRAAAGGVDDAARPGQHCADGTGRGSGRGHLQEELGESVECILRALGKS